MNMTIQSILLKFKDTDKGRVDKIFERESKSIY